MPRTQHNETDFRVFRRRTIYLKTKRGKNERCLGCVLATTVHIHCAIVWIWNESLHFVCCERDRDDRYMPPKSTNLCISFCLENSTKILRPNEKSEQSMGEKGLSCCVVRFDRKNEKYREQNEKNITPKWCRRFVRGPLTHTQSSTEFAAQFSIWLATILPKPHTTPSSDSAWIRFHDSESKRQKGFSANKVRHLSIARRPFTSKRLPIAMTGRMLHGSSAPISVQTTIWISSRDRSK